MPKRKKINKGAIDTKKQLKNIFLFQSKPEIIAHEINTPINLISSSVAILNDNVSSIFDLIKMYQKSSLNRTNLSEKIKEFEHKLEIETVTQDIYKSLIQIQKAVDRVGEISYNLSKSNERIRSIELKVDVNKNIKDTLTITETALSQNIKVHTEFGNVPPIHSFKGKLNQVFSNLIENAIQAINNKPTLNEEFLFIKTSQVNNSVVIIIKDSGCGMTLETKNRLFETYYSTKKSEKVSGLGLAICKDIIEIHNGTIEVDSILGKETTFTITLPIKKQQAYLVRNKSEVM